MPHLTASDSPSISSDHYPSSTHLQLPTKASPRVSDAVPITEAKPVPGVIESRAPTEAPRPRPIHSRLQSFTKFRNRIITSPFESVASATAQEPTSVESDPKTEPKPLLEEENADSVSSQSPVSVSELEKSQELSVKPDAAAPLDTEGKSAKTPINLATKLPQALPHSSPLPEKVDPAVFAQALRSQAHNMHQTSSRLLRMTDDDRPFTRDFKDLFSTLMVSLPLTPHRVRFTKVEHTFTTDEAITNLGSLKFSQSNRMPDPKDPSRIVTTTTTTTFSMAKEMARSVCTKFLEARFIESCEGKTDFNSKSSVWQLTPKGMRVLTRFCSRNGIHQRHVNELLDSPRNMMQLVILEREAETDKLNHDRPTVEVIFKRFAGESGPNVKAPSSASDTDSLSEYATGLVGVRVTKARKVGEKESPYIFTGKSALDWLIDCCMVVDKRECYELANLFTAHELIAPVPEERHNHSHATPQRFQATKNNHYLFTDKGMRIAGWIKSPSSSMPEKNPITPAMATIPHAGVTRDSNTNRMTIIIRDPALRLLFREFLQEIHCEENLTFYLEVKRFLVDYGVAKRSQPARLDLIRETLASAYSLYNAFLAPGSPCELNIDHNLRNALAGRMTRAVGEDTEMLSSLDEVAVLFDQAQTSVFKLMASDSVPKFSRDPKYATVLRDRNLEHLLTTFSGPTVS